MMVRPRFLPDYLQFIKNGKRLTERHSVTGLELGADGPPVGGDSGTMECERRHPSSSSAFSAEKTEAWGGKDLPVTTQRLGMAFAVTSRHPSEAGPTEAVFSGTRGSELTGDL